MRIYTRLLARATDVGTSQGFRQAPAALLPPIQLYRTILRTHRKRLGVEERVLGDMYVKAEFRAHQKIDNPVQIVSCHGEQCMTRPTWLISIGRLGSFQNGNYTPKPSRVTLGKATRWTRGRLTK
jgi:hypothetical protein